MSYVWERITIANVGVMVWFLLAAVFHIGFQFHGRALDIFAATTAIVIWGTTFALVTYLSRSDETGAEQEKKA